MRIQSGRSFETDGGLAVEEIVKRWQDPKPSMLLVFASTKQDLGGIGEALSARFPRVPIAGCTTSGEQLDGEPSNGATVIAAIESPTIRWETALIEDVFDPARIHGAVETLFERFAIDREAFEPEHYVALTLIDGLSRAEENYIATLADALEGIQVVGGSAGDDLAFKKTCVLEGRRTASNAAVLVLAHAPNAYRIIKHQHFARTGVALAVTRADAAERRVYELDGVPAAEAFAQAIGTTREQLTGDETFLKPVLVSVSGDAYVRSIQQIEADGSIRFYCAVEEGMVFQLGAHEGMVEAFSAELERTKQREPAEFLITFNCILRALEADKLGVRPELGRKLSQIAKASVGFDTYGEQLNGMHINQTLVGLALRG